jgi:hypothetical protein
VRGAFPNLDRGARVVTESGIVADKVERTGTATAKQLGAAAGNHDRLLTKRLIMKIKRISTAATAAAA